MSRGRSDVSHQAMNHYAISVLKVLWEHKIWHYIINIFLRLLPNSESVCSVFHPDVGVLGSEEEVYSESHGKTSHSSIAVFSYFNT